MFAFRFASRRYVRRRPQRVRRFESCERRFCLSGGPVIDQFQAAVGSGDQVNISGHVSDPNPAGIQVAISGPVAASVTTNASGNFSYSGTASSLGTESAVATDSQNLSSATVQTQIVDNPPVVANLSVAETGSGKNVLVTGQVQSASPGGLTVALSGEVTASTVTNSAGYFGVTTTAAALGAIDASTVDVWGVASATAQVQLTNAAPSVTVSAKETGPNRTLTVSGHVTDAVEAGAVVTISGIVSGTATTDSAGNYSLVAQASGQGALSVSATDVWGLTSSVVQTSYTSKAPVITLQATVLNGGVYAFKGTVSDEWAPGLTVTLSGAVGGTAIVQADGTFEFDSSLEYGAVDGVENATVTDWWGNTSNIAQSWVD
jgi:hypothetical protein